MVRNNAAPGEDVILTEANRAQLEHFREADPRCRALQLPEGILLRYTFSQALYFYLRSGVGEGKITTRVFASDSPYDRQKASIGEVCTPMFEPHADERHLQKLERLLRAWIDFVGDPSDSGQDFKSFQMGEGPR